MCPYMTAFDHCMLRTILQISDGQTMSPMAVALYTIVLALNAYIDFITGI